MKTTQYLNSRYKYDVHFSVWNTKRGVLSCNFTQFLQYRLLLTKALSQRSSLASPATSLSTLEQSPHSSYRVDAQTGCRLSSHHTRFSRSNPFVESWRQLLLCVASLCKPYFYNFPSQKLSALVCPSLQYNHTISPPSWPGRNLCAVTFPCLPASTVLYVISL